MIYFTVQISNPWYKESSSWKNKDYFNKTWQLSARKFLEIQFSKFGMDRVAALAVDLQWRGRDHAGPSLQIDLLGFMFELRQYDHRHWDYENGKWEEHPE